MVCLNFSVIIQIMWMWTMVRTQNKVSASCDSHSSPSLPAASLKISQSPCGRVVHGIVVETDIKLAISESLRSAVCTAYKINMYTLRLTFALSGMLSLCRLRLIVVIIPVITVTIIINDVILQGCTSCIYALPICIFTGPKKSPIVKKKTVIACVSSSQFMHNELCCLSYA